MVGNINNNKTHSVRLDAKTRLPVDHDKTNGKNTNLNFEHVSRGNHDYYRKEFNRFPISPAGAVAGYGLIPAIGLLWERFGPATVANFALQVDELLQVWICNTNKFGNTEDKTPLDPNDPKSITKGQVALQRREGAIAWLQTLGGLAGFGTLIHEKLKGEDEPEELSFTKKLGLSISSLITSGSMFITYAEKSLCASFSGGLKEGNEAKGMKMNANSDARVCVESAVMALYPWLPLGLLKTAVDISIPLIALNDSLGHMVSEGISSVFRNKKNFMLPQKLREILRWPLYFGVDHDQIKGEEIKEEKSFGMPRIYGNWYFGKGKFREKVISKIFKFLGCKNHFPDIHRIVENGKVFYDVSTPRSKENVDDDKATPKSREQAPTGEPAETSMAAKA